MKTILIKIEIIFDKLEIFLESRYLGYILSSTLVFVFLLMQIIAILNYYHISMPLAILSKINSFSSITTCFNLLLFYELAGLIFVIPHSIANSIGKQYEILSLILLRSAFEEFGHSEFPESLTHQLPQIYKMASDGISALIIFGLIHLYYSYQKHRQITSQLKEKENFVRLKKLISLCILLAFFVIGTIDLHHYYISGHFEQSFHVFYLILIFADMLFMLVALRYVIHYPNIFRYSAFVLITIFIRISLMAPVYYNGILGIFSVLFGLGTIYLHNKFFDGNFFDSDKVVKI